MGSCNYC